MKKYILGLLIFIASSSTGYAQVVRGTSFYFDHTVSDQSFVESYQLCVGPVATPDCRNIGVTRVGTTIVLTFTLPSWVPNGMQNFSIRAVWKTPLIGTSDSTNVLALPVVGPPSNLKLTNP